ncbi:DUF1642 domain-containing protein [Enterococcus faecalis]|nr:DUF1642 domain-containing protein [Enterococcus faecalis]EGO5829884.1 DUF1642 domain-containing protein [Enterococcus faecalis]EGO6036276.1 DUF1642 domain-containing protein [Enterococcus faecalis]EHU9649591.1 DUF1642 domain-containing protein [Enterococcus faecalis]EHU9665794.1 DUF1642 domain-containing protein [Enterococcus faecalis]EHU9676800.1 DUF1642 domain-containing protein [Enterococcus faecalis]
MNKQEKEDLIQALYDIGGCDAEDEWSRGYDDGVNAAIEVVKEIKVQEKAIVPKFVAYWFEDNFEELDWELGGVLINAFNTNRNERSDFQDWLVDTTNYPIETLIRMKLFGYEVEKEQLYKVVIDHKYLVQLFSGRTDARLVEYEELTNWHDSAYKLTESVIKSIDERYWPFAVKVDGE